MITQPRFADVNKLHGQGLTGFFLSGEYLVDEKIISYHYLDVVVALKKFQNSITETFFGGWGVGEDWRVVVAIDFYKKLSNQIPLLLINMCVRSH